MSKRLGKPIQGLRQQSLAQSGLGLQRYTAYNLQKQFILFAYSNFFFVCNMRKGRLLDGQEIQAFADFLFSRDYKGWSEMQEIQMNNILKQIQHKQIIAAFYIQTIRPTKKQKKAQLISLGVSITLIDSLFNMLSMPLAQQKAITQLVGQISRNIQVILTTATGNNNTNVNAHVDGLYKGQNHQSLAAGMNKAQNIKVLQKTEPNLQDIKQQISTHVNANQTNPPLNTGSV